MKFLKGLPIVTILFVTGLAIYFSPEIKNFLSKNAPEGVNKFLNREPKAD